MGTELAQIVQWVAMIAGPTGAAYVGVKAAVNGMRSDVTEIKADVKELRNGQSRNRERIVAVETRLGELPK